MPELERQNDEVYYAGPGVVTIGPHELDFVKERARANASRRARICTHPSTDAALHEMFIVHERGAYVRPHAHAKKAESFYLVEGAVDVVLFDALGEIEALVRVAETGDAMRYYRIPPGQFHTLLVRSEWLVFHEVTTGPFRREETLFPDWAPAGGDRDAVAAYLAGVEGRLLERRENG